MAKISKILTKQIIDSKKINSLFKNAHLKNLNINCSILNGDFYIDSHNYFPITYKDVFFIIYGEKTLLHVLAHVIFVSNILSHLSQRSIQTHSREFYEKIHDSY